MRQQVKRVGIAIAMAFALFSCCSWSNAEFHQITPTVTISSGPLPNPVEVGKSVTVTVFASATKPTAAAETTISDGSWAVPIILLQVKAKSSDPYRDPTYGEVTYLDGQLTPPTTGATCTLNYTARIVFNTPLYYRVRAASAVYFGASNGDFWGPAEHPATGLDGYGFSSWTGDAVAGRWASMPAVLDPDPVGDPVYLGWLPGSPTVVNGDDQTDDAGNGSSGYNRSFSANLRYQKAWNREADIDQLGGPINRYVDVYTRYHERTPLRAAAFARGLRGDDLNGLSSGRCSDVADYATAKTRGVWLPLGSTAVPRQFKWVVTYELDASASGQADNDSWLTAGTNTAKGSASLDVELSPGTIAAAHLSVNTDASKTEGGSGSIGFGINASGVPSVSASIPFPLPDNAWSKGWTSWYDGTQASGGIASGSASEVSVTTKVRATAEIGWGGSAAGPVTSYHQSRVDGVSITLAPSTQP